MKRFVMTSLGTCRDRRNAGFVLVLDFPVFTHLHV